MPLYYQPITKLLLWKTHTDSASLCCNSHFSRWTWASLFYWS